VSIEPCTIIRETLRNWGRPALFFVLLFSFTAPPLAAQEEEAAVTGRETIDSPYRWRERGMRLGLSNAYHAGNRGNLDFGQGPAYAIGAKFRARVSSPLSFDLGLTYGFADRWVVDPRIETGPAVVDTVAAGWLRADIGAQIGFAGARTWNGIHPYALIGGGWVFGINEGASEVFADPLLEPFRYNIATAPQIFVGLGGEIFPSERFGIGLEVRDHFIRQNAPDGFLLPGILAIIEEAGAPAPVASAWLMNFEFGITLWYYF
jgi:hypothetical protein